MIVNIYKRLWNSATRYKIGGSGGIQVTLTLPQTLIMDQDDMHESGGTNPWDHTPIRTLMCMMGMSMPRVETMQRENEIGKLEAQISQLECHFNYLDTELSKLGNSVVQTPKVSQDDLRPRQLLESIPKTQTRG